jgi:hypothetical protein
MSNVDRARIWAEWNSLVDSHPAPVKTIAKRLGLKPSEVAAVVYPPATFGAWAEDQELEPDEESPA